MYYAKFRNITNGNLTVREAHSDVVVASGQAFYGDVEALMGDSRFQRIREILPTGNYRFNDWDREEIIKALHRMGVEFNQYSMTTGRLAEIISNEYVRQQQYVQKNGMDLTPPPPRQPKVPAIPVPTPEIELMEITKEKETEKVLEVHNEKVETPVEPSKEKSQFQKETEQYVEKHLGNIKERRKVEQAKKFDQRKLNVDTMIIFLSKHVDDWKEYDFVDTKWPAFERVKKLKKEGTVEGVDEMLQEELDAYKGRLKLAPKKWTGATKDQLLKLIKKMGNEVTEEHQNMEKKKLMVCVKAMFELHKRNGLSLDTRKYFYEYGKDGKPIKK